MTTLFEVLKGERPISDAEKLIPKSAIDASCAQSNESADWTVAETWAYWWLRRRHLRKYIMQQRKVQVVM